MGGVVALAPEGFDQILIARLFHQYGRSWVGAAAG
jgi:hypothetical protein